MKHVFLITDIKPYSPSELARIYGVSLKTFNRWIPPHRQHIGVRNGRYYTTRQVQEIFKSLGPPPGQIIEE